MEPANNLNQRQVVALSPIIAVAAIVPSILVGVLSALAKPAGTSAAAAGLLSAAIIAAGLGFLRFRSGKLFFVMLLLTCIQAVLFAATLSQESAPIQFRLTKAAIVLSYAALASTSLLAMFRITAPVQASLLSYSVLGAVFAFEAGLETSPETEQSFGPEWSGQTVAHSELGVIYAPHGELKSYYPDNPRGYFRMEDARERTWQLRVAGGDQATAIFPEALPEVVRVSIAKITSENDYDVQLRQPQLAVQRAHRYALTFRARAEAPRSMYVGLANNHEPWANLGFYRECALTSDWQEFTHEFEASEEDENAQLIFDLGNAEASVEFSDVTLRDAGSGRLVRPNVAAARYFVSYSMNSLGCRGRDYEIPRPRNAHRIVVLGDSYTLGVGVHQDDTFASCLERLLNDDARTDANENTYEVVNCGISGFGTREERLYYHHTGVKYEPNVVLLAMVFNDDMSFAEEVKRGYYLRQPGWMESLFFTWQKVQDLRYRRPFPDFGPCVDEIRELNDEVRTSGARLAVVVFRNDFRHTNSDASEKWDALTNTVTDGLKHSGIPLLDLGPILLKHPKDLKVHRIDGHPNEIAHHAAARAIQRFLNQHGLLRANSPSTKSDVKSSDSDASAIRVPVASIGAAQ